MRLYRAAELCQRLLVAAARHNHAQTGRPLEDCAERLPAGNEGSGKETCRHALAEEAQPIWYHESKGKWGEGAEGRRILALLLVLLL